MSTSLNIYPLREVEISKISHCIAECFKKLSGYSGTSITISLHNELEDGGYRWAVDEDIFREKNGLWYGVWENSFLKQSINLSIMDPNYFFSEERQQAPVVSVPDITVKSSATTLLQLSTALGVAAAMDDDIVFHSGEFNWFLGEFPVNSELGDFSISLSLVDRLPNSEVVEIGEVGVTSFFRRHPIS
jgi:hypothetical protein